MGPQGQTLRYQEKVNVPQVFQEVQLPPQQRWSLNRYLLSGRGPGPAQEQALGRWQEPAPGWEREPGKRAYLPPYR